MATNNRKLATIVQDLASTTDPAKGAGLVGYSGRTVHEKLGETVSVNDGPFFGDLQAAIDSGASTINCPSGTYSAQTFDVRGKYITLVGDGIGKTILRCSDVAPVFINAAESSDVRVSPLVIKNMTIDGNSLAGTVVDIRYRHLVDFQNVRIFNGTAQSLKAKDTWLMRTSNCLIEGSPIPLWLVGANHRSHFDSTSFQGATSWHIKIESNGTALGGNDALLFTNCDVESADVGGAGVYIDADSVTFDTCYLGEALHGPVIQTERGEVRVNGGILHYGADAGTVGIVGNGGKTRVRGAHIAAGANGSMGNLFGGTADHSIRFEDCKSGVAIGGDNAVPGNQLDYGPAYPVFCARMGKNFTGTTNATTITESISGNAKTVTCATVTGGTPLIGAQTPLINKTDWIDGATAYLLLTYAASKSCDVKLSGGAMGGSPSKIIGILPATAGVKKTYIKLDSTLDSASYTLIEVILNAAAVGDVLTLYECTLADSRMLNSGGAGHGSFGNLYKC